MKVLFRLFAGILALGYLLAPAALIFAATPKPTCQIIVTPSSISVGGSVTVKWTSTNATGGAITNVGNVGPHGSINLLPSSAAHTTYFGAFTGPGGTTNCQASVAVSSASTGGTAQTVATTPAVDTTPTPQPTGVSSGLVPCGYGAFTGGNESSSSTGCQACNLAQLIQNVMTFAIGIAIPIAAALFAYAGFLYITSTTNPANIGKAKGIFKDALIGFLIAICAWLIINTLLHVIFSQGTFASGNWFTIQCDSGNRPVKGNIAQVLSQLPIVAGNTGAITPDSGVNTSGGQSGGSSDTGGGTGSTGSALDNAVYNGYDQALSALQTSCTASNDPNSYSCYGLQSLQSAGAVTDSAVEALQNACDSGDQASCTAATTASAAVGDNYDNVKATLQSSCDAGNQDSCSGLASLTNAGSVTDTAYETMLANCENGETASCSVLQTIVPGTPSQVGRGDCSPSTLSGTWGNNANVMSCIAQGESSCIANRPSSTDRGADGSVFSYGLYQMNLTAGVDRNGNMIASDPHNLNIPSCMATNGGQPLNCAQAFSGTNYNSRVVNQSTYQSCVNAASNVQCNTDAASALFNQVQSRAGTAAAYMQWGAYRDNHCGG